MAETKLTSPMAQRWGLAKDIPAGRVYIGEGYAPYTGGTPTSGYAPIQNMTADVEVAVKGFPSLSPAAQKKVYADAQRYYRLEIVPESYLDGYYESLVKGAYQLQQSQGLKVAPLDYPDYMRQVLGTEAYSAKGASGRYTGPTTQVGTYETINLTNPSQARQFLDDALGQVLGRRPTDLEYKNFTSALNAAQEAAPSITESVTTTTPQGKAKSTTRQKQRTRGGVSEAQLATEFARSQDMAAETAGGTTGFDAFLEAIGG